MMPLASVYTLALTTRSRIAAKSLAARFHVRKRNPVAGNFVDPGQDVIALDQSDPQATQPLFTCLVANALGGAAHVDTAAVGDQLRIAAPRDWHHRLHVLHGLRNKAGLRIA